MYTGQLAVYRKSIVDRIGGFRPEMAGAEQYDPALRFTEESERIGHVPEVLYHRRAAAGPATAGAADRASAASMRALQDRLARRRQQGEVRPGAFPGCFDVRYALARRPAVSIVIPTAGGERMVRGERV